MPTVPTTILVGSFELPATTITVGGLAVTIPAGTYYLRHDDPALSLIDVVAAEILADAGVVATIVIMRSLRTSITFGSSASISWGSGTLLRDALGFTGTFLGATTTFTSQERSRYLFSAGRPATLATDSGLAGYDVEDAQIVPSADGSEQDTDHHATHVWQDLAWDSVPSSRVRVTTSTLEGNTWYRFRRHVMVAGYRFHVYELALEDLASTVDVLGWPDHLAGVGNAYKVREIPPGEFRRKIDNANSYWGFGAKLRVVPDLTEP